jgi:ATP-dependent RNA helicase DeaD
MELRKEIEKAIEEMGFVDFTEIQKQTIPLLLEGKDIIGHSHTGTGKTAAFGIPILEKLDFNSNTIQALIIAPTRELAVQIHDELMRMAKYIENCKIVTVFGGDPITRQIYALKQHPQIIVGTPGRTIDHMNRKTIKVDQIKFMVLDEADEMLKMGFQEDIETIFKATPATRQTLMFSATMPKPILHLAKSYMNEPEMIRVIGEESTNSDVVQHYYKVKRENKTEALYRLINIYRPKLSLVFCNTKVQVDELTQALIERGINCDKIHGDLPQTTRMDVLKKFHNGIISVLVATDVAARGLDIKSVEAVFNYDVPEKADYYVHRIGRTGRIGNVGYSFTLVSKGEMKQISEIERLTNTKIKKRNIPTYDKVQDVKNDKLIEEMTKIVETANFDLEYEILNKAISSKLTEDQIIVALLKMIQRENNAAVNDADINEEFELKDRRSKFDANSKSVRFHLNLGKNLELGVSDILDFIRSKVTIENKEIQDIAILTEFSFFTVPSKYGDEIMQKCNYGKLKGKKAVLSISNKPRKPTNFRR